MSYALVITELATEDLHRLIDSLPTSRRRDALDAVDSATLRLAANPGLGQSAHLGRRAFHFSFAAGGTRYHWGVAFVMTEDESTVVVTHIFRLPL